MALEFGKNILKLTNGAYMKYKTPRRYKLIIMFKITLLLRLVSFVKITYSNRPDSAVQLAKHWVSILTAIGSISTVTKHILSRSAGIWTPTNTTNNHSSVAMLGVAASQHFITVFTLNFD